ncbi:hypothetical protein [Paracidovorax avenae]|uniref:hypothetical protein n=1 Tax=Paracidovorax avenae TaxID=80867 RepID=UPI001314A6AE|nr:hypothetical protein [Paracidovorax avenae]
MAHNQSIEISKLMLESIKLQAETRYAVKLTNIRLDIIEEKLGLGDIGESDETRKKLMEELEESLAKLDPLLSNLLRALEELTNG